jgi:hypothetical protein
MALCEEKDPGRIRNFATFGRRLPCWCALFSAEEVGLRFMLGSWLPAPRTGRRRRPAEGAERAAELGAGEVQSLEPENRRIGKRSLALRRFIQFWNLKTAPVLVMNLGCLMVHFVCCRGHRMQ